MNATLNIISPLCVIQTLLTLLKNWCLSPPLYLLLQSRGRFLTVLFISFVTDQFFEKPIRKILDFFRNYKAKKLILFSITKVNQKVFLADFGGDLDHGYLKSDESNIFQSSRTYWFIKQVSVLSIQFANEILKSRSFCFIRTKLKSQKACLCSLFQASSLHTVVPFFMF